MISADQLQVLHRLTGTLWTQHGTRRIAQTFSSLCSQGFDIESLESNSAQDRLRDANLCTLLPLCRQQATRHAVLQCITLLCFKPGCALDQISGGARYLQPLISGARISAAGLEKSLQS